MCDLFVTPSETRKVRKSFPRTGLLLIGGWLLAVSWLEEVRGQMFSADEPRPKTASFYSRSFSAGPEVFTLEHWGEGLGGLEVDDMLLGVGFDAGGVSIRAAFTLSEPSPQSSSVFTIGAAVENSIRLAGGESMALLLPFRISTDYLQVSRERVAAQFRQSSLRLGGGMGWMIRRGRLNLSAAVTPELGFSYSQGSVFGGGTRGVEAELRMGRIPLGPRIGLEGVYRYVARRYDIDGDLYDYNLAAHRVSIGVAF